MIALSLAVFMVFESVDPNLHLIVIDPNSHHSSFFDYRNHNPYSLQWIRQQSLGGDTISVSTGEVLFSCDAQCRHETDSCHSTACMRRAILRSTARSIKARP